MDKKVIFAVAGSGKTTLILKNISLEKRALIITYTNSNVSNLREGIIKKFGYFPTNIKLLSYYNFLYTHCYRPFLSLQLKAKGINWKPNPNLYAKNDNRFVDNHNRLYSNRIASLVNEKGLANSVNQRLGKYFDIMCVDEVQDLGGNDFNLLKIFIMANIDILLVGDFYQHTYDTSRDGITNKSLHIDYNKYKIQFSKIGFTVDTNSLIKSYRCSPTICDFITQNTGIKILSHRSDETHVNIINTQIEADEIFNDSAIVKLFYQDHHKYNCYSQNWGGAKGEDKYTDVCVVLNKTTWAKYKKDAIVDLPALTKNKLYVACSRAKNNLHIVSDEYYKKYKT